MKQYKELLKDMLDQTNHTSYKKGYQIDNLGVTLKFDLIDGHPLSTIKKVDFEKVLEETFKTERLVGNNVWLELLVERMKGHPYADDHTAQIHGRKNYMHLLLSPSDTVSGTDRLDIIFNVGSANAMDIPDLVARYSIIMTMFAYALEANMGKIIINLDIVNLFPEDFDEVRYLLTLEPTFLPSITIDDFTDITSIKLEDIKIHNYKTYPPFEKGE